VPVSSLSAGKALVDRLVFSPSELDELKTKLLALSRATVTVRGPERDGNGHCIYIRVPDNGIQLAATVKALEFAVGKPKVMLDIQTSAGKTATHGHDLGRLLANNADLTATILRTLKEGLQNVQAIDLAPLPLELEKVATDPQSVAPGGSEGTMRRVSADDQRRAKP
jgi:hypothetical protein